MRKIYLGCNNKELKKIVDSLGFSRHCYGCEGIYPEIEDPLHHPSIEITTRCNHNCIFCYSKIAVKNKTAPQPGFYGKEDFIAVTVSQYGEPFMEFDRLLDELKGFRDRYPEKRIDLQTNGTLITEKRWKKIEKFVDIAMISINAGERDKHRLISGADTFQNLLRGIEILGGSDVFSIGRFVYLPGINDEQIVKVAKLLKRFGIDQMMIHQNVNYRENEKYLEELGYDKTRSEEIAELLLKVDSARRETDLDITIQGCSLAYLRHLPAEALAYVVRNSDSAYPVIKRRGDFEGRYAI